MATYFVASGGSNTSPYDTWAKAATSLQTALTAASSSGDVVVIQYDGVPTTDQETSSAPTYTIGANISIISSTNSGTDTITPTAMETSGWIGHSTSNRTITLTGAYKVYFYGLTFRTASGTACWLVLGNSDGMHFEFDSCYLYNGCTGTNSHIYFGATGNNAYARLANCKFRFGNANHSIRTSAKLILERCSIDTAGSVPTGLLVFTNTSGGAVPSSYIEAESCDFSHLGASSTLVASGSPYGSFVTRFSRCLIADSVTRLASQTPANRSSGEVWLFDCSEDGSDKHGNIEYHNAFGSCVTDRTIYYTSGAAGQSWKVTTNASTCSFYTPFEAPYVDLYNTGTSAVTPYFEILRDGSSTAYQNDEVWAQFSIKETASDVQGTFSTDRMAIGATPANQAAGAGTGSWSGENATAWSGKCDSGSARTPAENGHIRGRIVVGEPGITVYVDPQIRT